VLAPPPVQPCAQATTTSSAPRTTLDFSNSFLLACGRGRMPGGEQAKGQRRNLRKARRRLKWAHSEWTGKPSGISALTYFGGIDPFFFGHSPNARVRAMKLLRFCFGTRGGVACSITKLARPTNPS